MKRVPYRRKIDTGNPELDRLLLAGERGPYRIDDYMALPEDGPRYQLMRGWLIREPSPLEVHQRVVGNLYVSLRRWVDNQSLGRVYVAPFDTVLSDQDVVQPDILYISHERLEQLTRANLQGAPDLAVEVLSDSTRRRDREVKAHLYREAGVREIWIMDPKSFTLAIHATGAAPETLTFKGPRPIRSPLLGQLDFTVAQMFE